jgi:hypothetical protein
MSSPAIGRVRCIECGGPTEDLGPDGNYCPQCNHVMRNGTQPRRDLPELLDSRVLIGKRMAGGVEPPEELLERFLLASKIHKIFSGPGEGKSFLAKWVALELVRSCKRVLYFDNENGAKVVSERMDLLGAEPGELDEGFFYFSAPDLTLDPDALAKYRAILDHVKPHLVIFDSWIDFLTLCGLDENGSNEVTAWMQAFAVPAKERGAAVLLLDHVPNDAKRSRGSSQKLAKVDVSWQLKKVLDFDRRTIGQLELRLEKDREGSLPKRVSFAVGGSEGGFIFRRDAEVFERPNPAAGLTDSERQVLECIEAHGAGGVRWKEIETDSEVSKSTLSVALKKLISSNLVTKVENRYHPADRTEPGFPIDKGESGGSARFDSGSTEPSEPCTPAGGSGGSVSFRYRTTEPGAEPAEVEELLANPPDWLRRQLERCREDPGRLLNPTASAIADEVFGSPALAGGPAGPGGVPGGSET